MTHNSESRWDCSSTDRPPCRGLRRDVAAAVPILALALALTSAICSAASPPVLTSDTQLATAGYFQLRWRAQSQPDATARAFELEQRGLGQPRRWRIDGYRSFAVTGLPDGEYQYRVRALEPGIGSWSEPVTVSVEHHSLARALGFLAAGALVFLGLAGVIVFNRKR